MLEINKIICGDALEILKTMPNESIDMVMTSPPYWALRCYLPDVVQLRKDLTIEELDKVKKELTAMNTYNKKEIPEHLRKYFEPAELGLEPTFQAYISRLCDIFDEVKRVLKKEGTCWVNMGDTYMNNSSYSEAGRQGYGNDKSGMIYKKDEKVKEKCLCQIPSRFAIEMTNRGWILRNEIIWHKPNCMPSSADDRFTVDFEKLFFFTKSKKYYFETQFEPLVANTDMQYRKTLRVGRHYITKEPYKNNIPYQKNLQKKGQTNQTMHKDRLNRNPKSWDNPLNYNPKGKNKRTVWKITTKPYKEAHFATYPKQLCITPIRAGCPEKGIVLDIFMGAGTTGIVALELDRNYLGIELNPEYILIAEKRIKSISNKLF